MSSATAAPRPRSTVLVVVDLVVSAAVLIFALVFGLASLVFVGSLSEAAATCADCSTGLLSGAAYGLLTVTVLGFFLGLGFSIVRVIRKRAIWPWAVGTLLVLIAAFYLAAVLVNQAVPAQ